MDDNTIRRLGWAGHITRMEDERVPKIVKGKFFDTRPRKIWDDVIQTDT